MYIVYSFQHFLCQENAKFRGSEFPLTGLSNQFFFV